jgi:hypothetical protein
MKKTILSFAVYVAVILVLATGTTWAQSNGTVKGTVKDSTGAILPGATVTLTDKATQRAQSVFTSEVGSYFFPRCRRESMG